MLCRVLDYFALQFLVARQVSVQREDDLLNSEIVVEGLSWRRAQVSGEKRRDLSSGCALEVRPADAAWPQAAQAAGQ